jgi:NADPH-dependent 2,4-dienoyl-CoA reductase/sulfur reductase-like enzyme
MVANEHLKKGVRLTMQHQVREIVNDGKGNVKKVVMTNGTEIDCDMVVVGQGIKPNTEFLRTSDIQLAADGGLVCDPFLNTSDPNIFAAGDIVQYPYWPTGKNIRCEHWIVAQDQGSFSAFNMLGKLQPYGNIPFFWTRHYDKSLQVVGHAHKFDEVHVEGDVFGQNFIAYYMNQGRILQVSGMGRSSDVLTMQEAMHQNVMPSGQDVKSGKETPKSVYQKLKQSKGLGGCRRENCCRKKNIAA